MKRLPNLLIAGFPRCGTTWLFNVLSAHPDIFVPYRKEIHFFDRHFSKGIEWYADYFSEWADEPWALDVTPGYVVHAGAARLIRTSLPEVRIVIVLRNPVDRFYSNYLHEIRIGMQNPPIDVMATDIRYIKPAFYYERVKDFKATFSDEELLIMKYEDSLVEPRTYIGHILDFLGFPEDNGFDIPESLLRSIVNPTVKVKYPALHRILRFVNNTGRAMHRKSIDLLLDKTRDWYRSAFVSRMSYELEDDMRMRFESLFIDDVRKLSGLLGTDLAGYWGMSGRHEGREGGT